MWNFWEIAMESLIRFVPCKSYTLLICKFGFCQEIACKWAMLHRIAILEQNLIWKPRCVKGELFWFILLQSALRCFHIGFCSKIAKQWDIHYIAILEQNPFWNHESGLWSLKNQNNISLTPLNFQIGFCSKIAKRWSIAHFHAISLQNPNLRFSVDKFKNVNFSSFKGLAKAGKDQSIRSPWSKVPNWNLLSRPILLLPSPLLRRHPHQPLKNWQQCGSLKHDDKV